MPQQTCSDIVVGTLTGEGVSSCFANPGTTEMHLVAALEKSKMRSILCLHECVVTGACDGYARMQHRPALALLHLGPGLGNGLCNLHNARRAGSPVLVLVGDMATWHRAADPPLNQPIEALAAAVSGHVFSISSPASVAVTISQALAATRSSRRTTAAAAAAPGGLLEAAAVDASMQAVPAVLSAANSFPVSCCPDSKVVTVLLPHDISWTEAQQLPPTTTPSTAAAATAATAAAGQRLTDSAGAAEFLRDCAAAMKAAPRGKVAICVGGAALLGDALPTAGRIASHLGATLLCEALPARIDRGAGLPHPQRLPYFPQEAAAELRKYELLLLLDVRRPVATFGYKDGPSQLIQLADEAVWELDAGLCVQEALALLEAELPGAAAVQPGVNCRGVFATAGRPPLPSGPLTAAAMCQVVAALQPADCIVVDESLTSGNTYWACSKGCPAFSHLCLTGGAIGSGPPMATGAAVAQPERRVINLQADGSGMYSLQALWTQAREGLKVLTIICANNKYAILQVEAVRQRTGSQALTSLAGPQLDWVALATGMGVPGGCADSAEQLAELVRTGLARAGPFLIHAALIG